MRAARSIVAGLLALAGASACAAPVPPTACPLAGQHAMVVAELYFGRAIAGRAPLTEDEWHGFAADVVSAQFPDGFTSFDGDGAWRDPATGATGGGPTKIVVIAVAPSPELPARLGAVIEAYRARYHQKAVGLITTTACAAF
jgi:hypothetical protein